MEEQVEQHQKWWLKNKRLLISTIITIITIIAILIAFALLVHWFGWGWTGFTGGESKVTTTMITSGTSTATPETIVATEQQPTKTLWDWLQLLGILAIPVVVGLGTVWFTLRQTQTSEANRAQQAKESEANREKRHLTDLEIAEKNRERQQQTDLQIAANNQHEAAFRAYLDKISELLVEKRLDKSPPDDQVRKIARLQTLAVLIGLDDMRKGSLIQFLWESDLINNGLASIIYLYGADLSGANLSSAVLDGCYLGAANLSGANLSKAILIVAILVGANLSEANLHMTDLTSAQLGRSKQEIPREPYAIRTEIKYTNLSKADLSEANLSEADLSFADLSGANFSEAILYNASLRGAKNITTEELEKQAKSLKGATMPDGSIHP